MALKHPEDVEALADLLTQCANEIHDRLMAATRARELDQEGAHAAFAQENALRQHANSLYLRAAKLIVADLATSQQDLLTVVGAAKTKMASIKKIAAVLDLVADLLALAVSAAAAKPGPILAALKEVRKDVDDLGGIPV